MMVGQLASYGDYDPAEDENDALEMFIERWHIERASEVEEAAYKEWLEMNADDLDTLNDKELLEKHLENVINYQINREYNNLPWSKSTDY